LLAQVCRLFPIASTTEDTSPRTLADSLYLSGGEFSTGLAAQQVSGELGVFRLAAGNTQKRFQALLLSGYWMDAAFVAERVLTLDELKGFCGSKLAGSARCQGPNAGRKRLSGGAARLEITTARAQNSGTISVTCSPGGSCRANRFREARRTILPHAWRPSTNCLPPPVKYTTLLCRRDTRPGLLRRRHYHPAIRPGNCRNRSGTGLVFSRRQFPRKASPSEVGQPGCPPICLAASAEEIERGARHAAVPELRWPLSLHRGALAAQGGRLMRTPKCPRSRKRSRPESWFEAAKRIQRSTGTRARPT